MGVLIPKGTSMYSRKRLDALERLVTREVVASTDGSSNNIRMAYVKTGTEISSSLRKFFSAERLISWVQTAGGGVGDLLVLLAGGRQSVETGAQVIRRAHAKDFANNNNVLHPLWVVDFPLLALAEDKKSYQSVHHPFTRPLTEDIPLLDEHPLRTRADAYDLVINGVEVGGGSMRIADVGLQEKILDILGFRQGGYFDFFLDALRYGTPPHGGIALGIDRLCAILTGNTSIRDFIPFPKTTAGRDAMTDAPSALNPQEA